MNFEDEDTQEYVHVLSTLPEGYSIRRAGVDRKAPRKYRLTIAVTRGDGQELKWPSRWIMNGPPRGRSASAERECIDELSYLTWIDLQSKSCTTQAVPMAPRRDSTAVRDAAPEPGSLKEPGVGGAGSVCRMGRRQRGCWPAEGKRGPAGPTGTSNGAAAATHTGHP